jgi:hypothetical protein
MANFHQYHNLTLIVEEKLWKNMMSFLLIKMSSIPRRMAASPTRNSSPLKESHQPNCGFVQGSHFKPKVDAHEQFSTFLLG